MKNAIIGILLAAVAVISVQAQTGIGGVKWTLKKLDGRTVAKTQAFLEFDEATSRVTGNAGCNRLFGSYQMNGTRFDAGRLGTTKMACFDAVLARTETAFLKALGDADRVRKEGRTLTLLAGRKELITLQRAGRLEREPVTADLGAIKWILRSVKGKSVDLSRDAPFLNFDTAKGSAGGNSGCNVFGGGFEVTGTAIKFSEIMATMRACEFEGRMEVERGFLDALRQADRFEVTGKRLSISRGGKLLLEFEGVAK